MCDDNNRLHVIVNDTTDQGLVDHEISSTKYAMLDLYGRCEQLAVVPCNKIPEKTTEQKQEDVTENDIEEEKISTEESEGCTSLLLFLVFVAYVLRWKATLR